MLQPPAVAACSPRAHGRALARRCDSPARRDSPFPRPPTSKMRSACSTDCDAMALLSGPVLQLASLGRKTAAARRVDSCADGEAARGSSSRARVGRPTRSPCPLPIHIPPPLSSARPLSRPSPNPTLRSDAARRGSPGALLGHPAASTKGAAHASHRRHRRPAFAACAGRQHVPPPHDGRRAQAGVPAVACRTGRIPLPSRVLRAPAAVRRGRRRRRQRLGQLVVSCGLEHAVHHRQKATRCQPAMVDAARLAHDLAVVVVVQPRLAATPVWLGRLVGVVPAAHAARRARVVRVRQGGRAGSPRQRSVPAADRPAHRRLARRGARGRLRMGARPGPGQPERQPGDGPADKGQQAQEQSPRCLRGQDDASGRRRRHQLGGDSGDRTSTRSQHRRPPPASNALAVVDPPARPAWLVPAHAPSLAVAHPHRRTLAQVAAGAGHHDAGHVAAALARTRAPLRRPPSAGRSPLAVVRGRLVVAGQPSVATAAGNAAVRGVPVVAAAPAHVAPADAGPSPPAALSGPPPARARALRRLWPHAPGGQDWPAGRRGRRRVAARARAPAGAGRGQRAAVGAVRARREGEGAMPRRRHS